MNTGVGAWTLIDCIAAIPCAGYRRPSAVMTKLENANRAPAPSPQPSAVTTVKATRRSPIARPQTVTADGLQTPLAAASRA
jgi:hypothetical protein